ncbi:unnamed protein product, partial [Mesorhabditis spiculigera]
MLSRAVIASALLAVVLGGWGDPLRDLGVPNYDCGADLMKPSAKIPTNVNSVRPGDIKVVMALGDSITAANGAGAEDPLAVVLQYRGLAFMAGGDKSLEQHVTIPNILKKYNPKLYGYSLGIGGQMVWEVAQFNLAYPGANAKDLPDQAKDLVARMKAHSDVIDMANDWKLLNIFIGGNDICGLCRHPDYAPSNCVAEIHQAVQYIQDNVPRVIVNLMSMLHLELLRQVDTGNMFCLALHTDECGCEQNKNFTDAMISAACTEYQQLETKLQDDGIFEKDDFTYVVQPFANEIIHPPSYPNGTVDSDFFCPDCFHFSQYGHAVTATWVWKNMLEPVGKKTTKGDFSGPALPLSCPDPKCPFIRTPKNSADCSKYMTE